MAVQLQQTIVIPRITMLCKTVCARACAAAINALFCRHQRMCSVSPFSLAHSFSEPTVLLHSRDLFAHICAPSIYRMSAQTALRAWLQSEGWPEDAGSAENVSKWLVAQDVYSAADFIGLGLIQEIPGAELLSSAAASFLQKLVKVISQLPRFIHMAILRACFALSGTGTR